MNILKDGNNILLRNGGAIVVNGAVPPEPRLPDGYKELMWVALDKGQRIDLSETLQITNPAYETEMLFTNISAYGPYIAGSKNNRFRSVIRTYASEKSSMAVGGADTTTGYCPKEFVFISIDYNHKKENTWIIDDKEFNIATGSDPMEKLILFTYEGDRNNTNYLLGGFVKYFKFYDNGQLIYDLVPCIRENDSIVGMYDLVGYQFYSSNGTRNFIAGPDVV